MWDPMQHTLTPCRNGRHPLPGVEVSDQEEPCPSEVDGSNHNVFLRCQENMDHVLIGNRLSDKGPKLLQSAGWTSGGARHLFGAVPASFRSSNHTKSWMLLLWRRAPQASELRTSSETSW